MPATAANQKKAAAKQQQQDGEGVATVAISDCNIGIINSIFENIGYYSDRMYNSVTGAGGGIALKIRGFTEAMQGKADPTNVVVAEQHLKYINSLTGDQYAALSKFATDSFPNLGYEDQKAATLALFNGFYRGSGTS